MRHFVKFAGDSVIVSLLSSGDAARCSVVADSIEWCESSRLNINVSKAKEMTIDFRRNPTVSSPLLINNPAVEREQQYKYLSTGIVDKLPF